MNKTSRILIPEYIVRGKDRERFVDTFSNKLWVVGDSYKNLKSMPDLVGIPDNLQDINAEVVENFINERLAEIDSTKMLTAEAKRKAKEDWENIRKKALSHISAIKEVLATYPDADITINDEEVVCKNFGELVTEKCKVKVPDEVTEWANLILDVKDSIDALRKFKNEHELPNGNLYTLSQDLELVAEPTKLAESWLFMEWRKDYLQKHPHLQGAYDTNLKRGLAEQNARLAEKRKKHFEEHPEDFMPLGNKTNPYVNQHGPAGDCLDYSVEIK